jgi:sigma-B regulation protein RsbU (phosphoserine phosphatase)
MKIRKRLSLLFICGALLPLLVLSVLHYVSMQRMGAELALSTQNILTAREKEFLQKTIHDYSKFLQLKKQALQTALGLQAKEMERLLNQQGLARNKGPASDLERHTSSWARNQKSADSESVYAPLIQFSSDTEASGQKGPKLSGISNLQDSYWFIKQCHPELIHWQSLSLETGLQLWFPGHEDFPEDYVSQEQSWYQQAKQTGKLVWQVEQDPVSGKLMQVAAMPVFDPEGNFLGVTAMHISLANFFQAWQLPKMWEEQAQAALVAWQDKPGRDADGLQILAYESFHRYSSMVRGGDEDRHRYLNLDKPQALQPLFKELARGYPGVSSLRLDGREMLFAYGGHDPGQPFPLLMLPRDQVFAQAQMVQEQVEEKTRKWLKLTIGSMLGALVLSTLLALFSARTVIRPVMKLASTANALAHGDFSSRVSIYSGDELQELGNTFNDMSWRLQENERMRHAMAVARETQQYLLPKQAPRIKDFDISGRSIYSDETGGDYFDFIELEDAGQESLGVAVGDVSGHGLGVALLMASARGVIRSHAARFSSDLGTLFQMLNEHLLRDTGDGRFLTLFYCVLDAKEHTLTWNSAGHEPGLWLQREKGRIVELPSTGMPLGISRQAKHAQAEPIQLQKGDIVLLGTDGVRETRNQNREMFGRERVEGLLRKYAHRSTREILANIVQSLEDFRGQTSQEDDVTLVAIKYQPEEA